MRLTSRLTVATLAAILGVVAARSYAGQQAALQLAGLQADSLAASRDTTRRLALAITVLADGTQAVQRRALQVEQRSDSLDRALKLERKAKGDIRLDYQAVLALNETAKRVIADSSDSVRYGSWVFKNDPRTPQFDSIAIDVRVPRPPALPVVDLAIGFRPTPLSYRLSCGAPDPLNYGVRAAQLTVTAPKWLRVYISDVEQDPALCNPPPAPGKSWFADWRTWVLAGTAGLLIAR